MFLAQEDNRNTNRPATVHYESDGNDAADNDGDDDVSDEDGKSEGDSNNANQVAGGRKKWGPDKGRGGRIIDPASRQRYNDSANGRGQLANESIRSSDNKETKMGGEELKADRMLGQRSATKGKNVEEGKAPTFGLSKVQKRRKNDNKSKIANHHRKDRALKKTGGM